MQNETVGVELRVVNDIHDDVVDDGVAKVRQQVAVGMAEFSAYVRKQAAKFEFVHGVHRTTKIIPM
jgi:hypothetical protein